MIFNTHRNYVINNQCSLILLQIEESDDFTAKWNKSISGFKGNWKKERPMLVNTWRS